MRYVSCVGTGREVQLPELKTTVFIIPDWLAKNGEERIVVLNEVAGAVVDRQRRRHPEYVFTYNGHRLSGQTLRRIKALAEF